MIPLADAWLQLTSYIGILASKSGTSRNNLILTKADRRLRESDDGPVQQSLLVMQPSYSIQAAGRCNPAEGRRHCHSKWSKQLCCPGVSMQYFP